VFVIVLRQPTNYTCFFWIKFNVSYESLGYSWTRSIKCVLNICRFILKQQMVCVKIGGCARVWPRARVFTSVPVPPWRTWKFACARVFSRVCAMKKSNQWHSGYERLLYDPPGENQVDGLPPVSNLGAMTRSRSFAQFFSCQKVVSSKSSRNISWI
jgi:hypothetical protein